MQQSRILISPNGKIICKVFGIHQLNPASFGSKYFFSDLNKQSLYFNQGTYLQELATEQEVKQEYVSSDLVNLNEGLWDDGLYIRLLRWSIEGDSVFFYKYYTRGISYNVDSVFIDFSRSCQYRFDRSIFDFVTSLDILNRGFETKPVNNILKNIGLEERELVSYQPNLFERLFKKSFFSIDLKR